MKGRIAVLMLALCLALAGAAFADSPPEAEYLMNVVDVEGAEPVSFLHYNGSLTAPPEMNVCRTLEQDPWYRCGIEDMEWDDNIVQLDPGVYFVGWGVTSYDTTLSAEEFGWSVTESSDGFFWQEPSETVEHVFDLRVDPLVYVYSGNGGDIFPRFLNFCRHLDVAPWFQCGTMAEPAWEKDTTGKWVLKLDSSYYFIGSGGSPLGYAINPEWPEYFGPNAGWWISPNQDGFAWSDFKSFTPIALNN